MSRRTGGIIGPRPAWTTTATSGIFSLGDVADLKAAAQWPRGPVAPTSLAGTGADTEVALTWTAPATTHGTITNYAVEYTPSGGSPTVVLTGSTSASYTVTGLTNDTEYTFRVLGINHTPGDWSESVAVTAGNAGPPAAVVVSGGNASAQGTYTLNGTVNDRPKYSYAGNDIFWAGTYWGIWYAGGTAIWGYTFTDSPTPPYETWTSGYVVSEAP